MLNKILNDKKGISELVSTVIGLLVMVCMLMIAFIFITLFNRYTLLNEYASELIKVAGNYGVTQSINIDERSSQLKSSLGIDPDFTFTADEYFDSSKNVQYGNLITGIFSMTETINFIGFKKDIDFIITKTTISDKYWK